MLPDTVPDAYVSQGKDLLDQLLGLWVERRVITVQTNVLGPESQALQQYLDHLNTQRDTQRSIIESFGVSTFLGGHTSTAEITLQGLVTRLIVVSPFHFVDVEFTAHELSGAGRLYDLLFVRRRSMSEVSPLLELWRMTRSMLILHVGYGTSRKHSGSHAGHRGHQLGVVARRRELIST